MFGMSGPLCATNGRARVAVVALALAVVAPWADGPANLPTDPYGLRFIAR
jgi:hypothetical protein